MTDGSELGYIQARVMSRLTVHHPTPILKAVATISLAFLAKLLTPNPEAA
jgi:hypothetical protein